MLAEVFRADGVKGSHYQRVRIGFADEWLQTVTHLISRLVRERYSAYVRCRYAMVLDKMGDATCQNACFAGAWSSKDLEWNFGIMADS